MTIDPPAQPAPQIPPPTSSRPRGPGSGSRRAGPLSAPLLLAVAGLVAVGGIAFAAGRVTAPVAAATTGRGAFGNGGFGRPQASGAPAFRNGLGNVDLRGTVTAVNGDTITVDLSNGRSIQVKTDASTTYHQSSSATASAVTSGSTVIIQLKTGQGSLGLGGQNGQSTATVDAQDITVGGQ
jgi:hypothetical protein